MAGTPTTRFNGHGSAQPGAPPGPWGRVEVHAGPGLVLRRRHVLLVLPVVTASHRDLAAEVVRSCADAGEEGGRGHVRRLTRLLARDDVHGAPAFACLTALDDDVLVLVHGAVRVRVDGTDQGWSPGAGSSGWVERPVPATFTSLSVGDVDEEQDQAAYDVPLDLRDGCVPGGGVTLHRSGTTAGPPVTTADAAARTSPGGDSADRPTARTVLREAPKTRVVSLAPRPPDPSRRQPPLPVGAPARAGRDPLEPAGGGADPAAPSPVQVSGVVCDCGELNSPDSEECRACGATLDPARPLAAGPRPPLGILITDDGRVFTLTDDVVVGREPGQAPEVRAGLARPLVLRDSEQSTSRVHALVRLVGWEVEVVDRGSANGTFISRSGSAGPWAPVAPGPGTSLAPGDRLRLGKRQLLFDRYRTP